MSVASYKKRKHAALVLIHLKLPTPVTQRKKKKAAATVGHVRTAGFIYSRHVIPGALSPAGVSDAAKALGCSESLRLPEM